MNQLSLLAPQKQAPIVADRDTWATPQRVVDACARAFGRPIVLDVCAFPETAKAAHYITPSRDAFATPWRVPEGAPSGGAAWCNPPFGGGSIPYDACSLAVQQAIEQYDDMRRRAWAARRRGESPTHTTLLTGIAAWAARAEQQGIPVLLLTPCDPSTLPSLILQVVSGGRRALLLPRVNFEPPPGVEATSAAFNSCVWAIGCDAPPVVWWR